MLNDTATIRIASEALSAEIAPDGAELQTFRDGAGRDLQWDGDPAVWRGRAPILFPIVGELAHGEYRCDGRTYALPRHGFARNSRFDVVARDASSAAFRLVADAATRAVYPFDFRLDVLYALDDATLAVTFTVANDGARPMPASLGFHPAFRWPLPYGEPRGDHAIRFSHVEAAPVRRLDGAGLVLPAPQPTPVTGDTLALVDADFDADALIFDALRSRSVRYGASRGPRLAVRFEDFPVLGVWTKPGGAGFICIEPWHGLADPVGFEGTLDEKPFVFVVAPGASRVFSLAVTLEN